MVALVAACAALLYSYGWAISESRSSMLAAEGAPPKTLDDIFARRSLGVDAATRLEVWAAEARDRTSQPMHVNDVLLHSQLARFLLESAHGSRPPRPERLAEGRKMAERAATLSPKSAAALWARMALLLAEGNPEDALEPAAKLLQVDSSWHAHEAVTHAYLAAGCSMACKARRYEQILRHAPEGAVHSEAEPPAREASSKRAAAMWRVMEAGRTAAKGASLAPADTQAAAWRDVTKALVQLDAFRVSTSDELFKLAGCTAYEGLKLDGKRCPAEGDNPYAKKKARPKGGKRGQRLTTERHGQ